MNYKNNSVNVRYLLTYIMLTLITANMTGCFQKKSFQEEAEFIDIHKSTQVDFSTNAYTQDLIKNKAALSDILKPQSNTLVIYASQNRLQLSKLLNKFAKDNNIDVTLVSVGKNDKQLLDILKAQQKQSHKLPVDLVLLKSKLALMQAGADDLFQAVKPLSHLSKLPKQLRADKNHWYGVAASPRVLAYHKNSVPQNLLASINSINALTDAKLHGRLCLSTLDGLRDIELLARIAKKTSYEQATKTKTDLQKNAKIRTHNDAGVLQAIKDSKCQMGLVSSYSYEQFLKNNKLNSTNSAVQIHFFADNLQPVNLIGMGVAKYSTNPLKALSLLEWLTRIETQVLMHAEHKTLPVTKALMSTTQYRQLNIMANTDLLNQQMDTANSNNRVQNPKKKRETSNSNTIKTKKTVSLGNQSLLAENKASSQQLQTYYQQELNALSKIDNDMLTTEQQLLKSLLAVKLAAIEDLNQVGQHNWLVNIPDLTDKDIELGYQVVNPKHNLPKQNLTEIETINKLNKDVVKSAQQIP